MPKLLIDYSAGVPSAAAVKAAGYVSAVRYVSPPRASWMAGKPIGIAGYDKMIFDIGWTVENTIKALKDDQGDAIPILFRPLHEIDGGWFWWTNEADPQKTKQLYAIMFDRIKNYHQCHNLIWVWNMSHDSYDITKSRAKRMYPGDDKVDVTSVDIYHIDFRDTGIQKNKKRATYQDYWNILHDISPDKPKALGEVAALPNPTKTQATDPVFPKWLYALPWYIVDDPRIYSWKDENLSDDWFTRTYSHEVYISLDELNLATAKTDVLSAMTVEEQRLRIYPNPSKKEASIRINGLYKNREVQLSLHRIDGDLIGHQTIRTDEAGNGSINLSKFSDLVNGVYLIKTNGAVRQFAIRLVVE